MPTHIQYSSGWPCVYLQRDFSSNLTPLPGGFQGDVFNVLFMTRSNHSEWPQLLHKCRSNGGTTVDDGPVSSKGRGFVPREGSNLMTGKSIEHISLRDSINYLDWVRDIGHVITLIALRPNANTASCSSTRVLVFSTQHSAPGIE